MTSLNRYVPYVLAVSALFCIIELGLTAYIVSPWAVPSSMEFMLFNSVWTLLILAYIGLVPIYVSRYYHRQAGLALKWITTIFWFAGSIALAAFWGAPKCYGNNYCNSVEAACAFGFFLWLLFSFITFVDTVDYLRGAKAQPAAAV